MTIKEKAYEINMDEIDVRSSSYDPIVCHADNRNQAKVKLLEQVRHEDLEFKYSESRITYTNLPVKRSHRHDKVIFDDKVVLRHEVESIIKQKERAAKLHAILNDDNIKYCYIRKGGYYYRPNSCGYTEWQYRAGVYKKEEAIKDCLSVQELSVIPINIDEHNKMINSQISELQTRIIS